MAKAINLSVREVGNAKQTHGCAGFYLKLAHCCVFLVISVFFQTSVLAQSYNDWVLKSFDHIDQNQLDSAELALTEAMRLEPANPVNAMLLSNLGTLQRRNGKMPEAIVSYTAALSRAPQNMTFLANRASLFSEMGQPQNALIDYSVLLEQNPADEDVLYQRGMLYLQLKNYEAAQIDFERIVELNPQTLDGRIGIASLCKLRREYDEAERIYIYLIDQIKDSPELYAGRAELYLLMEKSGKAMSDANRAIALQPENNPYVYILRARIKLLQFEKISAANDVKQALSMGYDSAEGEKLLKLCEK